MSQRNKLKKFAEVLTFPNVYENFDSSNPILCGENGQEIEMKGQWSANHFNNTNPITLELACGRGEYTLALAANFPERNFIGIDIKGARIWRGAKNAIDQNLSNAAFLRTRIEQIGLFFEKNEVEEIWITFPDPFLKKGKSNRRLTAPNFLNHYSKILIDKGFVHLKTDDPTMYEFTLETLAGQNTYNLLYHDDDIYAKPLPMPELEHKTYYEKKHLAIGRTIKYVRFQLNKGI